MDRHGFRLPLSHAAVLLLATALALLVAHWVA